MGHRQSAAMWGLGKRPRVLFPPLVGGAPSPLHLPLAQNVSRMLHSETWWVHCHTHVGSQER